MAEATARALTRLPLRTARSPRGSGLELRERRNTRGEAGEGADSPGKQQEAEPRSEPRPVVPAVLRAAAACARWALAFSNPEAEDQRHDNEAKKHKAIAGA